MQQQATALTLRSGIGDDTRVGQSEVIALERQVHAERGTISMRQLLRDRELMTYVERIADKLAMLGARDPVNEIEIHWSPASRPRSSISLRWLR